MSALVANGIALVVANRVSLLLAPASGIAVLLVAMGLILLYDAATIGREADGRRSRKVRARTRKALLAALLIASFTAALVFATWAVLLRIFEAPESSAAPASDGGRP